MSDFSGVKTRKMNGGIGGASASDDGVAMLVACNAPATAQLPHGKVVVLGNAQGAADHGIDQAYDTDNDVLVYRHLETFFGNAPEGTLHLVLLAGNDPVAAKDAVQDYLLGTVGDGVRVAGVAFNLKESGTHTYTDGFLAETLSMVEYGKALVAALKTENVYLDCVAVDGRATDYVPGTLHDFTTDSARDVALVAGYEPSTTSGNYQYSVGFGDVGAFLGSLCVRDTAESAGSVNIETKPPGMEAEQSWPLKTGSLTWKDAHIAIGRLSFAQVRKNAVLKKELADKHIIYAGRYNGFAGHYWNASYTCTPDTDDFCRIERNRTWNKCARITVEVLTPKIRAKVPINEDGTISDTLITNWERLVIKRLNVLKNDKLISGFGIAIDPSQNVLAGEPIKAKLQVTPMGIAEGIVADIYLYNPYSS